METCWSMLVTFQIALVTLRITCLKIIQLMYLWVPCDSQNKRIHFYKQRQLTGRCNRDRTCFVPGRNLITKYCWDEFSNTDLVSNIFHKSFYEIPPEMLPWRPSEYRLTKQLLLSEFLFGDYDHLPIFPEIKWDWNNYINTPSWLL
jgi:hypothetical protein